MSDFNKEEFVEDSVENFRALLEESLDKARSPRDVKWAIFSTGTRELEHKVLDLLVDEFLPTIEGMYMFRVTEVDDCVRILSKALEQLEEEINKHKLLAAAEESDYVVTFGVEDE